MVRGDSRTDRKYLLTPNSHGRAGISLDSDPHMVARSHIPIRLCKSWGAHAPGRHRISASDPADSNFLNDSLPIFHRRLPTRPFRARLRFGSASGWSSESSWKCVGSLQADRAERLDNVQDLQPLSFPALSRNDSGCRVESLGEQSHKPSHTPRNLAHYHIRYSLRAHQTQHQIKEKAVSHDSVRGLTHQLRVLHLQANLLLPRGLVARQGRLMFEIIDCGLGSQVSRNQSSLYSATIRRHDHTSGIADGHNPIRIGPGKRPVTGRLSPIIEALFPPTNRFA